MKMERQRNNPRLKQNEELPLRLIIEIEVTKLSDIEFKIIVIRMLKELSENFREFLPRWRHR